MIYLALYKGNGNSFREILEDKAIRLFTRGIYSHCELAIKMPCGKYQCFSSSPRDNGVRMKYMHLPLDKWDLLPISDNIKLKEQVIKYYNETKGIPYDLAGALGVVLPLKQRTNKLFCSEWCFNALTNSTDGWRFSPNHLYSIYRRTTLCQ